MSGTTSSAPGPEYPYVLFWEWDITPSNPASMACFSQWFDRTFAEPDDPSVVYKTAEHYMMYHKALLFDPSVAQSILKAATPEEAKQRGREIKHFDRAVWARKSDGIVERGNYLKFGQNEDLKGYLLDTGEKVMVEASPTDRVWGIGFSVENAPGREKEWGDNRWVCGGLCVGSADHRMGLALTRAKKQLRKESEE
jgi:ribA/ribD-fused uncharacterized protein